MTTSLVASAGSNTAGTTIPVAAAAGQVAIFFDYARNSGGSSIPTDATPSGWTQLVTHTGTASSNGFRCSISYKILQSGDPGTAITGMSGWDHRNVIGVWSNAYGIASISVNATTATTTPNDPSAQVVTPTAGHEPLITYAGQHSNSSNPITGSPAGTEIGLTGTGRCTVEFNIFDSSASAVSYDIADSGSWQQFNSGYFRITYSTRTGTTTSTLGSLSSSATGSVLNIAALSKTLGSLSLSSTIAGTSYLSTTQTLGALSGSSAGTVKIAGTTSATLGAATSSSAAVVRVAGSLANTLGAATLSSTGIASRSLVLNSTLGTATTSSTATNLVKGSLSKTLGAATVSANGFVGTIAALNATLGSASLSSTGIATRFLNANNTLGSIGLSCATGVLVRGVAANSLGACSLSGFIPSWSEVADDSDHWTPVSEDTDGWTPVSTGSNGWTEIPL